MLLVWNRRGEFCIAMDQPVTSVKPTPLQGVKLMALSALAIEFIILLITPQNFTVLRSHSGDVRMNVLHFITCKRQEAVQIAQR